MFLLPFVLSTAMALSAVPQDASAAGSPATQPSSTPATATAVIREDGLIAEYFEAVGPNVSPGALIVLGGSEGGLRGSRPLARRLASEGFSSIAVSYFGEEGQRERLDQIPIEPVQQALAWLQARRPGAPVALVGVSKGAELALLTASREPRITAVVAAAPSHVVWQGIDQTGGPTGSSWTSAGEPLPYTPYNFANGFTGIFNLYRDSLPDAPTDSEIPVERIAGPILLVSGEADSLSPTAEMGRRIERRLQVRGFGHAVEHLSYPRAGHVVFGPPVAPDAPGLRAMLSLGGTIDGLVSARADGWPRVLTFLRQALGGARERPAVTP